MQALACHHEKIKHIQPCIMSALATLALSARVGAGGVRAVWNSVDAVWPVLFLVLWALFACKPKRRYGACSVVLAVLFSLATFLGRGVTTARSVAFLVPGLSNLIVAAVCLSGFFVIYRLLADAMLSILDRFCSKQDSQSQDDCPGEPTHFKRKTLPFVVIAGLLLLLWSPWLIAYLPGAQGFDTTSQIIMGVGMLPLTAHHPPFTTLLYTVVFEAGNAFGGVNSGTLATLVLQAAALLMAFAHALRCMACWGVDRRILISALLFWGLLPIIPIYVSWIIKDTLAAAAFVFFLVELGNILFAQDALPRHSWVLLCLSSLLLCLTRNDSIVCVVAALAVAVFALRKQRLSLVLCTFAVIATLMVSNTLTSAVLNIGPGNSRESLSFFVQATARCIREHPEDVQPWEEEVLLENTSVSDITQIGEVYDPTISDSVKALFDFSVDGASLFDYFRVWVSMGLRHPASYLASFFEGTVGYWYPFTHWGNVEVVEIPRTCSIDSLAVERRGVVEQWGERYGSYGNMWFPGLVNIANTVLGMLYNMPVVGQLFSPGTYTWLLVVLLAWLIRKKNVLFVLAIPIVVKVAICCASPLAGSVRYALPLIIGLPILLGAMTAYSMKRDAVS